MNAIPFTKMVGTGNDFIIVDTVAHRSLVSLKTRWSSISKMLCDRHTGIGADGVLVLERSPRADVRMRIFNADGSEAEMCGNGARCVAKYIANGTQDSRLKTQDRRPETGDRTATIETKAGMLSATVAHGQVAMRMTAPTHLRTNGVVRVDGRAYAFGSVNTGVPHVVIPVTQLARVNVETIGQSIRSHRMFAPRGTNVNFIQPDATRANRLRVRTYERGVEAETLACGTGIVASAIIYGLMKMKAVQRARTQQIDVEARSGDVLRVSFAVVPHGQEVRVTDVILTGGARRVFDGAVEWPPRDRR
ncbi:MAG: diaminopimelate epimerase [Candidatus Omnitrophica bacterium]|nr:diaminopimelate epimerase [Candidatus Omnitrophota bacterium]